MANFGTLGAWHYRWRGWFGAIIALGGLLLSRGAHLGFKTILLVCLWLVGLSWRVWARNAIGSHSRASKWEAPQLLTQGAYGHCRHPLYLSSWWLGTAWLLWLDWANWYSYLFEVLWSAHLIFLALSEELYLQRQFGDQWRQWTLQSPFWSWKIPPLKVLLSRQIWSRDAWTWLWLGMTLICAILWSEFIPW